MNEPLNSDLEIMTAAVVASYAGDERTQRIGQRFLPSRKEIVDLLDHPHDEVRSFAHAAVQEAVGRDLGVDKRSYLEALRARR